MKIPVMPETAKKSKYDTVRDWIINEAISFSPSLIKDFHSAIHSVLTSCSPDLQVLGFGEPLHGGREILSFRNRLFQYLVENHGFRAISIESSFPRGYLVQEYIENRTWGTYDQIMDTGFSHGFGHLEENRELVEWMRSYNKDLSDLEKVHFYGFDSPTEMTITGSPGILLNNPLEFLISVDENTGSEFFNRMRPLIGDDTAWENPASNFDPYQGIGLTPSATSLRMETEELITELQIRRPELIARGGEERYLKAVMFASLARQLLTYHAGVANTSDDRIARLLGIRDAMMADILHYICEREQGRGKILVYAHNSHLKYGISEWILGTNHLTWWPAGSHLKSRLDIRYAVIGSGIGSSGTHGIGEPQPGTLEAELATGAGPVTMIFTEQGKSFSSDFTGKIPVRSGSTINSGYFPLNQNSITEYDWIAFFNTVHS
jgi:erythromycin esterase-like protein